MKERFLIGLMLVVLSACTIQKRQHLPGYSVQWKKHYSRPDVKEEEDRNVFTAQNDVKSDKSKEQVRKTNDRIVGSEDNGQFSSELNATLISDNSRNGSSVAIHNNSVKRPEQIEDVQKALGTEQTGIAKNHKRSTGSKGDHLLLIASGLIALVSFGGIHLGRKKLKKLTRWARNNPKKARYMITGLQLPLTAISIYGGYNMSQMGYEISDLVSYIGMGALGLSFASIPLLPKYEVFTLPKRLNRRRMAFIGATAAGCMIAASYGNSLGNEKTPSYAGELVASIDRAIFGNENSTSAHNTYHSIDQSGFQEEQAESDSSRLKLRQAASVGMCVLAVLIFIILTVTLCAGICLTIYGLIGALGMFSNIGMVLGGLAISVLSVLGMMGVAKAHWCRI